MSDTRTATAQNARDDLRSNEKYIHDLGLRFFDAVGDSECLEATCTGCGEVLRNNLCIDWCKWIVRHSSELACGGKPGATIVLRYTE